MGVWIETTGSPAARDKANVTPFVGVWIETKGYGQHQHEHNVTPFVGVWIETISQRLSTGCPDCHTLRGCVDWTPSCSNENAVLRRHTLRGCVDWNLSRSQYLACNACHTLRGCVEWNRKQILFSEPTWKVIFTKTCHWLSISYKDKKYDSGLF